MNAAVIGPGALGCLFAARLAQAGIETTLVDHSRARAARLAKNGVVVESEHGALAERPHVTLSVPSGQDLVLVLTKSHATTSLDIPSGQPVLTLQNGLGNAEALAARIGAEFVLAGSTSEAATLLDVGRVRHAAEGAVLFGAWTTCPTGRAALLLRQAAFEVTITETPTTVLWEKAVVSAAINPLTALLDTPNGYLIECEDARVLLKDLAIEATKVANGEGHALDEDAMAAQTEAVCSQTATNISSMLQDVRTKRPTEIEAITGEILRRAGAMPLPLPYSETVYRLIKALEHQNAT